ncbi:hypothetical protein QZH41_014091, partial [Actinostola sp. cb2023]
MPKKKTGARKKAEKQKARQKGIQSGGRWSLMEWPCNTVMGAICDFCETFVCHSKKCLTTHACECPLRDADCIECDRAVWDHGTICYIEIDDCKLIDMPKVEGFLNVHSVHLFCVLMISLNTKQNVKFWNQSPINVSGSCNKWGQHSCLRCK